MDSAERFHDEAGSRRLSAGAELPNVARGKRAIQSSYAPFRDARKPEGAGATGGVKTGGFGFHTEHERGAWWMLDLLDIFEIETILVFNREDAAAERASSLSVSLALDAAGPWVEVCKPGKLFGGVITGTPLTARLKPRIPARYVRLHLNEANMLHVDEVEVYASPMPVAGAGPAPSFPLHLASMAFPGRDGNTASWADEVSWLLFQNKYGVDLSTFRTRKHNQAEATLSGHGDAGFTGEVKTLRLIRYERFGNNFYQILNAAMLARAMNCTALQIPDIASAPDSLPISVDSLEIQPFSAQLPAEPALSASFFHPSGLENLLGAYEAAFAADTMTRFVYPVYEKYRAAAGSLDEHTIAMHFRGGDIFLPGPRHAWYVQPPAAFYIRALEYAVRRLGVSAAHLVFEDRTNPAVDAVIEHLIAAGIPYSLQSSSVFQDIVSLMSAHHLVAAYGTFSEASALLSPMVKNYFAFRNVSSQRLLNFWTQSRTADLLRAKNVRTFVIDDPDVSYIKPEGWENTPEQHEMIRSYPKEKLRLMERF
jgi:hypothetical protein